MKKIVFLSHAINKRTPLYAGRSGIIIDLKKVTLPMHAGTHIDAPRHFIKGAPTVTDIPAKELVFNKICLVSLKEIKPGNVISDIDFACCCDCELLMIKTGFEKKRSSASYWKNSPGLDPELAASLKKNCPSLRAVGVDFISISSLRDRKLGRAAHRAFLNKNILLIEDMKLSGISRAPDLVLVAPLLLEKADGAPATILGAYN